MTLPNKYFYRSQQLWIQDDSPLKLCVKSRQTGFSFATCFRLVLLVSDKDARLDAHIVSRDLHQARLQAEDCLHWADFLHVGARDLGEIFFDSNSALTAFALQFANGHRIYSLSSNPNALAGKRGHVFLDEFALHFDQRTLYRTAKPVTTWGGQFSIISTHRGTNTLFYQLVQDAKNGNPMGWSLHEVPIQKAVAEGIVERINKKKGTNESREDFLKRLRKECIDQESWDQEYCCIPADESAAFFSYEMLDSCTDPNLRLMTFAELQRHLNESSSSSFSFSSSASLAPSARDDQAPGAGLSSLAPAGRDGQGEGALPTLPAPTPLIPSIENQKSKIKNLPALHSSLFIGVDVARHHDLCVIDVGEKIGPIMYDRLRLEFQGQPYSQIEAQLYPLLSLPQLKYAAIDKSGIGDQLSERARERFGWKVEPVNFTPAMKEKLAFTLRQQFEDRLVRIPADDKLRADLRGLKKETTPSGKITFLGETADSHCDRTWAKALRHHAARRRPSAGAILI
jgi:phage FluMu gp28-like protein